MTNTQSIENLYTDYAQAKAEHDDLAAKYAGGGTDSPYYEAYENSKARLNALYRSLRALGMKPSA